MQWAIGQCDRFLQAELVQRLRSRQCGAIRIASFVQPADVAAIVSAINAAGIEYHVADDKAGSVARKGKLGPNFFRYRDQPEEYFRQVPQFRSLFDHQIFASDHPIHRLMGMVATATGLPVEVAQENGQGFMHCVARDLPAAPRHTDWLPRDCPALGFAAQFKSQYAWNLYLELPSHGGETVIYHREEQQPIVENTLRCTVRSSVADLLIFQSTNVHEVLPAGGKRLTVSGFFGITDTKVIFFV